MSQTRITPNMARALWPLRLPAVAVNPTEENLQRLCALLDVLDREVVARWHDDGHAARRAALSDFRRQAGEANRAVSAAQREAKAKRGAAAAAERRRRAS